MDSYLLLWQTEPAVYRLAPITPSSQSAEIWTSSVRQLVEQFILHINFNNIHNMLPVQAPSLCPDHFGLQLFPLTAKQIPASKTFGAVREQ